MKRLLALLLLPLVAWAGLVTQSGPRLFVGGEEPGEGAEPFFTETWESYSVGEEPDGGSNGFEWVAPRSNEVSDLEASEGTRSLRFRFDDIPEDSHIWAEQRFNLGRQLTEIWVEYYIYYPDASEPYDSDEMNHWPNPEPDATDNNKFFRLWGGGQGAYSGNPNKVGMSTRPDDNVGPDGMIFFEYWETGSSGTGDGPSGSQGTFPTWEDDLGEWIQVRMYYRHVSAPDAADAHFKLWKNGVLYHDLDEIDMEYHTTPYWDSGYLLGADNSHIATQGGGDQIYIFIDDIKFWDEAPAWDLP